MQTMNGLTALNSGPRRAHLVVQDHPVFQALPPNARSRIEATSRSQSLAAGEALPDDDDLYFVLTGGLGLFPGSGGVCVAMTPAGAVHGWDHHLASGAPRARVRALIDTLVGRVPAEAVLESMGRDWLERLVARQAPSRLAGLAAEAACNASHLVPERLAKWIIRLHCGGNGAPLHLTQADFGAMLGVQRTSINAAAGRLQALDLVRFGRGKVQVLDLAGLRQAACGCGEPVQASPNLSRRSEQASLAPEPASWSPAETSGETATHTPSRAAV